MTNSSDFSVFLVSFVMNFNVIETVDIVGRANTVFLAHLEIFTEVLVSAPPVQVDHTESFVSTDLMEVRVSHIVLFTVSRVTTITNSSSVSFIYFSNVPSPVHAHAFFLVLNDNVK
jgi:hypothetical protein